MAASRLTILLVEDSSGDARPVKALLARAGRAFGRVEHVSLLASALARLDAGDVDVVLLDLGLADCGGLDLFNTIQARAPSLPVVVLAGRSDHELALRAVQAGAHDYLIKGRLDGDKVMRSIRYAVERARLLRLERSERAAANAAELRFRDLLESVDAILWEMDFSTWTYSFVSKRAEDILGYPVSEWLDTPGFLLEHVHPEDRERMLAYSQELVAGTVGSFEVRVFAADGRMIWLLGSVMQAQQSHRLSAGMMVDITARKMLELLEREQSEILSMVAQSLPVDLVLSRVAQLVENQCPGSCACVLIFDNGRLTLRFGASAPPDLLSALGESDLPPAALSSPLALLNVNEDAAWQPCRQLLLRFGMTPAACAPILSAQGELKGALLVAHRQQDLRPDLRQVVLDTAIRLAGLLVSHSALEQQLSHQAYHDALTGLPNRALFNDRLGQSLLLAQRQKQSVAVMFIDLDGFKRVNDTLGHGAGDELLCMAAARFQSIMRRTDTMARMGGDEFMVVLNSIHRSEDAGRIARLLLDSLDLPFALQGHEIHVTASIGISFYPDDATEPATLQGHADAAMYLAKSSGRNCFRCYTEELNDQLADRIALEEELRYAIDRGELLVHYQPLYQADARLLGFEALVRWQHPVHGMISPERFIPIAEESKMIHALGRWVLERACRQCVEWRAMGRPNLHVAVNVSALQFQNRDWLGVVAQTLADTGLDPAGLELEITEGVLMQQADTIGYLRAIKELGVAIAIDDFGTGYSSLAYLQRLPVDTLKIDQSFVRNLRAAESGQDSTFIVEAIITLARGLGLKVLAEGVETEDQWQWLSQMGCDAMQGYFFGRPVSAQECRLLMDAAEPALPGAASASAS